MNYFSSSFFYAPNQRGKEKTEKREQHGILWKIEQTRCSTRFMGKLTKSWFSKFPVILKYTNKQRSELEKKIF